MPRTRLKRPSLPAALLAVAVALQLPAPPPVSAGTLEAFEKQATTPAPAPTQESAPVDAEVDEGFADMIVYGLFGSILYGGVSSWARVRAADGAAPLISAEAGEEQDGIEGDRPPPRKPGEALIPFARIDVGWQRVEDDVSALDFRGEVGYAMAGVSLRRTEYGEDQPRQKLTTTAIHGLYRMSFGAWLEVDLGMGALVLEGTGTHSGFSFTLPVLIHPSEHWGVELRPAWSGAGGETISDYDLAFLIGIRHLSLKAGYRWTRSGGAHLNGPQVGLSMRW